MIPEEKYCNKCETSKPVTDFRKNLASMDGFAYRCKPCETVYRREKLKTTSVKLALPKRHRSKRVKLEEQPTSIQKMVFALAENPKMTYEELGKAAGISAGTAFTYMNGNEFLRALRGMGGKEITRMIPSAVFALKKSLEANSEDVRLKAAKEVLQSERILGPDRLEVTVNALEQKSTIELHQMLENQKLPAIPSIEAEVVG